MEDLIDICEMDQSSRAAFQQLALTLHTPKQLHQGVDVQATETAGALVLVDSSTNFVSCVRTAKKNDFDIMVQQSLQFTQVLGHAECNYICDNEPTILQVQKRAVSARKALGLPTHGKIPAAYTHGNNFTKAE